MPMRLMVRALKFTTKITSEILTNGHPWASVFQLGDYQLLELQLYLYSWDGSNCALSPAVKEIVCWDWTLYPSWWIHPKDWVKLSAKNGFMKFRIWLSFPSCLRLLAMIWPVLSVESSENADQIPFPFNLTIIRLYMISKSTNEIIYYKAIHY